MTDPTADAAKLSERIERALRHLPEIAEILDRDNDRPIAADEARLAAALIRDLSTVNTRPQHAPSAGEPNFGALWIASPGDGRPGELTTVRRAVDFGERMYRLGLAARPKVDGAGVATEIALIDGFLAGTHGTDKESFRHYMKRWRDLLERLAGDLVAD